MFAALCFADVCLWSVIRYLLPDGTLDIESLDVQSGQISYVIAINDNQNVCLFLLLFFKAFFDQSVSNQSPDLLSPTQQRHAIESSQ